MSVFGTGSDITSTISASGKSGCVENRCGDSGGAVDRADGTGGTVDGTAVGAAVGVG